MYRRGVVIGLACALCACGAGVREVRTANGAPPFEAKCKSSADECLAAAKSKCADGYEVLDSDSHAGGLLADVLPGPVTWYAMTFRCSASGGFERPSFAYRDSAPAGGPAPDDAPRRPAPTEPTAFAPSGEATPSGDSPGPAPPCSSDIGCGPGYVCVKPHMSYSGTCARAVNEYGVQTFDPPRSNSLGPGEGQCAFDTECPIGFKCVKGTAMRGNCMK